MKHCIIKENDSRIAQETYMYIMYNIQLTNSNCINISDS